MHDDDADHAPPLSTTTAAAPFTRVVGLRSEIQKLKNELDSLVASCCPLCAGAVNAIDRPFVQDGELEI
ncbi:hypothetical protein PtB15_12B532 [Puccinia triticina]|nr:hypothetical protein PtB15_12B532 [Puccinia triticina]